MSMSRNAARELSVRLAYELGFADQDVDKLIEESVSDERFLLLKDEDRLYLNPPDEEQKNYIRRLVSGIYSHGPELDSYIQKYSIGWDFSRISRMSSAIMRLAMFEILYMPDIPNASSADAAVRLSKKYESEQASSFINGILGAFIRGEVGG